MRVTTLGHASALIEARGECILIDPIFDDVFASGTLCLHPARDIAIEKITAATTTIVVTHIHLDHFHPPTLSRFPRHIPIIVPLHDVLIAAVRALGFSAVTPLTAWSAHALGSVSLLATPSDYEMEEFGLLVVDGADSYWHMSDAIVTPEIGARVRASVGPVSLASVKFQPLRTLIAYQRGLASTMLDRDDLCGTFEAACAATPACLFPYYSGFAFHGEHAWANRHIAPYRANEIVALLRRRLGAGASVVTTTAGDVFDVAGRVVEKHAGASPLVSHRSGPAVQCWEPIDPATLIGVGTPNALLALTLALRRLLAEEVLPWVQAHLDGGTGLFDCYRDYQTVWQCVVHAGSERRLRHAIDFRGERTRLLFDHEHPAANVFTHVSGGALLRVLRGEAGPELFWMAGAYRIYEKILYLDDNRLRAPPHQGWELFEHLPDPLTHYLRRGTRPAHAALLG